MRLLFLWAATGTVVVGAFFGSESGEARIRMRKVKEEPKACMNMKPDPYLSRPEKLIYATPRNSVIVEENVSIVGDLGNKHCSWPLTDFIQRLQVSGGDPQKYISQMRFYIDEYKNILVPYIKKENGYKQAVVNLASCDFENTLFTDELQVPKCDPPKKKSVRRKKKVRRA
jgi:hypothetical protein